MNEIIFKKPRQQETLNMKKGKQLKNPVNYRLPAGNAVVRHSHHSNDQTKINFYMLTWAGKK